MKVIYRRHTLYTVPCRASSNFLQSCVTLTYSPLFGDNELNERMQYLWIISIVPLFEKDTYKKECFLAEENVYRNLNI